MKLRTVLVSAVVFVLVGSVGFGQSKRRAEPYAFTDGPYTDSRGDCGDFEILNTYSVLFRGILQLDATGNPVGAVEHLFVFDSTFYNSNDPSIFVEGFVEHTTRRWDFVDGFLYYAGPGVRVKVPGEQIVFRHTGHWIWNTTVAPWELVFQKGPSDILEGNVDALCRVLRPQ